MVESARYETLAILVGRIDKRPPPLRGVKGYRILQIMGRHAGGKLLADPARCSGVFRGLVGARLALALFAAPA